MPWELIDHQADVGLQATGASLEQALVDGVRGMLSLMVDPETVAPKLTFPVAATGDDAGALYVALLNATLAVKDIHGVFFHDITIDTLEETEAGYRVAGTVSGEPFDLNRHAVDSDVKAATYGGLRAERNANGWLLRCVLDL
jgi:SHS2 domain-containing protein